jgi:hypothetical protein
MVNQGGFAGTSSARTGIVFGLHNLALDSDFSLESSLELSTLFRVRLVRRERLPCQSIAGLVLDLVDYTETAASDLSDLFRTMSEEGRTALRTDEDRGAAPQAAPPRPANGRLDRVLHCGGVQPCAVADAGRADRVIQARRAPSAVGVSAEARARTQEGLSVFFAIFEIFAVASPSAAVATVALPLVQDPDFYLFEFACHEGNYWSMRSMLGGGRLARIDN